MRSIWQERCAKLFVIITLTALAACTFGRHPVRRFTQNDWLVKPVIEAELKDEILYQTDRLRFPAVRESAMNKLIQMGKPVVPYLIEAMFYGRNDSSIWLAADNCLIAVTGKEFHFSNMAASGENDGMAAVGTWRRWYLDEWYPANKEPVEKLGE